MILVRNFTFIKIFKGINNKKYENEENFVY